MLLHVEVVGEAPEHLIRVVTDGSLNEIRRNSLVYLKATNKHELDSLTCDYDADLETSRLQDASAPSEIKSVGNKMWESKFTFSLAWALTAVCWTLGLFTKSGMKRVEQNELLGYYYGGAEPELSSQTLVACTLEENASTCKIDISPEAQPSLAESQISNKKVHVYLSPDGVIALVRDVRGRCPTDPRDPLYAGKSTEDAVTLNMAWQSDTQQRFRFSNAGRDFLRNAEEVLICYAKKYCSAAESLSICTRPLGRAVWVGPTKPQSQVVTQCEGYELEGCIITIRGVHMNLINHYTPRLAVMDACGSTTFRQILGEYKGEASSNASEGFDPSSGSQKAAELQQMLPTREARFAVEYQLASAKKICWNPYGSVAGSTEIDVSKKQSFPVELGLLLFLPFPYVEETHYDILKINLATKTVKVNTLVKEDTMNGSQSKPLSSDLVHVHSVYQTIDDGQPCSISDTKQTDLSFLTVKRREQSFSERVNARNRIYPSKSHHLAERHGKVIECTELTYKVIPWSDPTKLCWRTIFFNLNGKVLHDYREHLDNIVSVSPAQLATTAWTNVEEKIVFCSQDDHVDDCVVTVKALEDENGSPALLPPNSQVFAVAGDMLCPVNWSTILVNVEDMKSEDARNREPSMVLLRVDATRTTTSSVTFVFPHADKSWMSSVGIATLCWVYGSHSDDCPVRTNMPCLFKLGRIVWRGPALNEKPLSIQCENSAACTITVRGRNLATLNLGSTRLALLRECGTQGGPGLLDITAFPAGYTQDLSWNVPSVNDFVADAGSVNEIGRFFVYARHRLRLTCRSTQKIIIEESTWTAEGSAQGCDELSVSSVLQQHCFDKAVCVIYPFAASASLTSENDIPRARKDEIVELQNPCQTSGVHLVLRGLYKCVAGRWETPAFFEKEIRSPRTLSVSTEDLIAMQELKFRIEPLTPQNAHICWNPKIDVAFTPADYFVDIGTIQILPSAGLADLQTVIPNRIDEAFIEITINSVIGEDAAKESFIYMKPVDVRTCDKEDFLEKEKKVSLSSCVTLSDSAARLSYEVKAPEEEESLCWGWAPPSLPGEPPIDRRSLVGTVPGAVNPRILDREDTTCGGLVSTSCQYTLMPSKVEEQYPDVLLNSSSTDVKYSNLIPFIQRVYHVSMVSIDMTCALNDALTTMKSSVELSNHLLKLPDTKATTVSIIVTLAGEEKKWLAVRRAARLCWVNEGSCDSQRQSRLKPCIADLGTLRWLGPMPLEWATGSQISACTLNLWCKINVFGSNFSLFKNVHQRVAVLNTCGEHEGPGLAKLIKNPTEGLLQVRIMLRITRDYSICWNPDQDPSTDLSRFTMTVGTVEFYGFRNTVAFCVSGSKCALRLPTVRLEDLQPRVAIKTSDCLDLNFSSDVGQDSRFIFDGVGLFKLRKVIPPGYSYRTYKLCWCSLEASNVCTARDYSQDIGQLSVQAVPRLDTTCAGSSCKAMLSTRILDGDHTGDIFLALRTGDDRECSEHSALYKVKTSEFKEKIYFHFLKAEVEKYLAGAQSLADVTVCWRAQRRITSGPPDMTATEVLFAEDGAILGIVHFAGPKHISLQNPNLVTPLGLPVTITIRVFGFSQLEGMQVTESYRVSSVPRHWRELRAVPRGDCGSSASQLLARLFLQKVEPGDGDQLATYAAENSQIFRHSEMDRFDICWCNSDAECSAAADFSVLAASITVLKPQMNAMVTCTYDTRCTFQYENIAQEDLYGLASTLTVALAHCKAEAHELPASGKLRKTSLKAYDTEGSATETLEAEQGSTGILKAREFENDSEYRHAAVPRQLETYELEVEVSRSILFSGGNSDMRMRNFSICYCANAKLGCKTENLVYVGEMNVYDVWLGNFQLTIFQAKVLTLPPPLDGVGGIMFGTTEGFTSTFQKTPSASAEHSVEYLLDMSYLESLDNPASTVEIRYCERQLWKKDCADAAAPRVLLAKVLMKGPIKRTWIQDCALGALCKIQALFFNPLPSENVSILRSCSSPQSADYGISDDVHIETGDAVASVSFRWRKALEDSGAASYSTCWCTATEPSDCTNVESYSLEIGKVNAVGLKANQRGSCNVGSICAFNDAQGYNLHPRIILRILGGECGLRGNVLRDLPNEGVFETTIQTENRASFSLLQPLSALAKAPAVLCQCSHLDGRCSKKEDFAWKIGVYNFYGPSSFVRKLDGFIGVPLRLSIPAEGKLNPLKDFFALSLRVGCTIPADVQRRAVEDSWVPLKAEGAFFLASSPLFGNVYYICYCHDPAGASIHKVNISLANARSSSSGACNAPASYRTLVGAVIITGPQQKKSPFYCQYFSTCSVDVVFVVPDSADAVKLLENSSIRIHKDNCEDGSPLTETTVESYRVEGVIPVESTDLKVRTVTVQYKFRKYLALAAGQYVACWTCEAYPGHLATTIGLLYLAGPKPSIEVVSILSGSTFNYTVTYLGGKDKEEVHSMRIRIFPMLEGAEQVNPSACVPRPEKELLPAFQFMTLNEEPNTIVEIGENVLEITWTRMSVVIDSKTPNLTPGDLFAVCSCDTREASCVAAGEFSLQIGVLKVVGPYSRKQGITMTAGGTFSYVVSGVQLPLNNSLLFMPIDETTPAEERNCGRPLLNEEDLPLQMSTVERETDKAQFKNIYITWSSRRLVVCWCGGLACSTTGDFRTEIDTITAELPDFQDVSALPGESISITLVGSMLRVSDRITLVPGTLHCGGIGTDTMDALHVIKPENSLIENLNDLGKARNVKTLKTKNPSGLDMVRWESWPMQVSGYKSYPLKVCYCSSIQQLCGKGGLFNVKVGTIKILGPTEAELMLTDRPYGPQKLHLSGIALGVQNRLLCIRTRLAYSTPEMRALCAEPPYINANTVKPDWINEEGTKETFPVAFQAGYRYILCWSPGVSKTTSGDASAPKNKISHTNDEKTASYLLKFINSANQDDISKVDSLRWHFIKDIVIQGFLPFQDFHAVRGVPGLIVVEGMTSVKQTYTLHILDEHASCADAKEKTHFQLKDPVEIAEDHLSFAHPPIIKEGLYIVCISLGAADSVVKIGYLQVFPFFWKSTYEALGQDTLVTKPCSVLLDNEDKDKTLRELIWMPDGTSVWTAISTWVKGAENPSLEIPKTTEWRRKVFYEQGLRSVAACTSDGDNTVYFVGPFSIAALDVTFKKFPDVLGNPVRVFKHGLSSPMDLTVKYPFIFVIDFQSHHILALNVVDANFSWYIVPTEPALLFAAGIEHVDYEAGKTALFVADTLNHIVGQIDVDVQSKQTRNQGYLSPSPWTHLFGHPGRHLQDSQGLSYPLTLARYTAVNISSTTSLLMVGELDSNRLVFLNTWNGRLQFYRQLQLSEPLLISGSIFVQHALFLASRTWSQYKSYLGLYNIQQMTDTTYFTYPDFGKVLQSGLYYSFSPLISGTQEKSFKEISSNGSLASLGMTLNEVTGEISGTVNSTGKFEVAVAASDLLGTTIWKMDGEAGCRSGEFYNANSSSCEATPIGAFRDQEVDLQLCENYKPHSSTLSSGSTDLAQCHCLPGFEIRSLGDCDLCPTGTYKASVADSKCTGKCPPNMHSNVKGADSEKSLNCLCDAGFYLEGDLCKPCPIGAYCTGDLAPPLQCMPYSTTESVSMKATEDCVCVAGYTRDGDECVMCDLLTYKSAAGNGPCTPCPQRLDKGGNTTHLLASTDASVALHTAKRGATQIKDCSLCASGFYYDAVNVECVPCPKKSYCAGLDSSPKACPKDTVTTHEGAETAFECRCPKGFGRSIERNLLDHAISCVKCPRNTFQHIEGADTSCIPCPPSRVTEHDMSTSFTSCLVAPGFFQPSQLEDLLGVPAMLQELRTADGIRRDRDGTSQEESSSLSSIGSGRTVRTTYGTAEIRAAETKYERMERSVLRDIPHDCVHGTSFPGLDIPVLKLRTYATSVQDCVDACARNLYCTSATLYHEDDGGPFYSQIVSNYTGSFTRVFGYCDLHLFVVADPAIYASSPELLQRDEEELGVSVTCIIHRLPEEIIWPYLTNLLKCPRTAFCPGGVDGQIYECPVMSLTISLGASKAEHCKCNPGSYAAGSRCEPCVLGTYKESSGSAGCKLCPPNMTTATVGSTSMNNCGCIPGSYMHMKNTPAASETDTPTASAAECTPCPELMYCPGLWLDELSQTTHMPPLSCPEGATVPASTVIADSISKCLCLPGNAYDTAGDTDNPRKWQCIKCAPGSFKELQENSACAGRCMKNAETNEGAVSKKQCYCKVGKFAVEGSTGDDEISCQDCIPGGVCPGGFKDEIQNSTESNRAIIDVDLNDHQLPFPDKGFYAVYKLWKGHPWKPAFSSLDSLNLYGPSTSRQTSANEISMRRAINPQSKEIALMNFFFSVIFSKNNGRPFSVKKAYRTFSFPVKSFAKKQKMHLNPIAVAKILHNRLSSENTEYIYNSSARAISALQQNIWHSSNANHKAYDSERVPDIHPCFDDRRCKGGPHNVCSAGAAGYLCSACLDGFSTASYMSSCHICLPAWVDILFFVAFRIVFCAAVWLLTCLCVKGVSQTVWTHAILLRILVSNFFYFSLFGLMPSTSSSALRKWSPVYRAFFFTPFTMLNPYLKVSCILHSWGVHVQYNAAWYIQRFFQLMLPMFDVLLFSIFGSMAAILYKLLAAQSISRVTSVLRDPCILEKSDFLTTCTVSRIVNARCLGLIRYLSTRSDISVWCSFRRLLSDLIPAYVIIWFWHYPTFLIECIQMLSCVAVKYKGEEPLYVLSSLPLQVCDAEDGWFLVGLITGSCGILLGGLGSVLGLFLWVSYTKDSDPLEERLYHSFVTNGYRIGCRAWESVVLLRKALLALVVGFQFQSNTKGAQEIFRCSSTLAVSVLYLIMQLVLEPCDRRSHGVTNRVELCGLLLNVANCVIIQGSYYFEIFASAGLLPLILPCIFYIYVVWSLIIESGCAVIMQPCLARIPSFWVYYNRVVRALARRSNRKNAKLYYNYVTQDVVLEATTKSSTFRNFLPWLHGGERAYPKIAYANRSYFVLTLTDAFSQVLISWGRSSIPGDWLDFTIRYSFCFCFWFRHGGHEASRIPHDLEEFRSIRPCLFSDWYYQRTACEKDFLDQTLEEFEDRCNQAESDLLDMMFDDSIYDDSPITLTELSVAVETMRRIPQSQLLRLHFWYRKMLAASANSQIPRLQEDNENLELELHALQEQLKEAAGGNEEFAASFMLEFLFTTETIHQARLEEERLRRCIQEEMDNIIRGRVVKAVAERIAVDLEQQQDLGKHFESVDRPVQQQARIQYMQKSATAYRKKIQINLSDKRVEAAEPQQGPPLKGLRRYKALPLLYAASDEKAAVTGESRKQQNLRTRLSRLQGKGELRVAARPTAILESGYSDGVSATTGSDRRTLLPPRLSPKPHVASRRLETPRSHRFISISQNTCQRRRRTLRTVCQESVTHSQSNENEETHVEK